MGWVTLICDVCGCSDCLPKDSPEVRKQGLLELSICPACHEELTIPAAEIKVPNALHTN